MARLTPTQCRTPSFNRPHSSSRLSKGRMSHPWDQVSDPNYFRRMFQNTRRLYLHNRKQARVRLSLSSDPSAPDYRVESPDGYQFDCAGSGQGDVDMSQLSEQTL